MSDSLRGLADTHCHLNLALYEGTRVEVLDRARSAGVERILVPGVDLQTSQSAVDLAQEHDELFAAVGVHPHYSGQWSDTLREAIISLAQAPKVVAIGEIGLDYYRNLSPPEIQKVAFEDQLEIARSLHLPVVIHSRDSIEDILDTLNAWTTHLPSSLSGRSGVFHAFSADLVSAFEAIRMGFYLGIAGPITFPKSTALRDIAAEVPSDRLVIETDSPYLTPEPYRGRRNEPSRLTWIAEKLNDIRTDDYITIRATTENARSVFKWPHEITDSNIL